ncbi:MAG: hypothetical protein ACE5HI_09050, partial [bacterium]
VRFLLVFRLLFKSCHSRILLAGIQDEQTSGYPIKAFVFDKSRACKNLTGHHWLFPKLFIIEYPI